MKFTFAVGILLGSLYISATAFAGDIVLKNGNFINPKTGSKFYGHMHIEGKTIKAFSSKVPSVSGAEVVDLNGQWVIPGLQDMHIHNWGDNLPPTGNFDSEDYDFVGMQGMGERLLTAGVTTYLDLFAPVNDMMDLRSQQRMGQIEHPHIYAVGNIFMVANGHPIAYHPDAVIVQNASDAAAKVAQSIKATSPDAIKFFYDNFERPDGDYTDMTKEVAKAIIDTAHKNGIKAIAHVGTWNGVKELADLGVDAVTHIPEQALPTGLVEHLKNKNVSMITTMAVYMDLGFIANPLTQDTVLDNDLLRLVTTAGHILAYRDPSKYDEVTKAWTDWSLEHNKIGLQYTNVRQLHKGGVRVIAGSDAGNTGTFIAYSIHRELKLMTDAGLSPMEALKTCTTNAHAFLGQNKGMEVGNVAELVVVEKSPLQNILNTQKVKLVILDGKIVRR